MPLRFFRDREKLTLNAEITSKSAVTATLAPNPIPKPQKAPIHRPIPNESAAQRPTAIPVTGGIMNNAYRSRSDFELNAISDNPKVSFAARDK